MTSSLFDESHRVDENQESSPYAFLEKENEKSSGFSRNDLCSPLLDDGLTSDVLCKISTMGASIYGDKHVKSWMEESPTMSGKSGGGADRRESTFIVC